MYYFKIKNNNIYKYNLSFDSEKLKKIRDEIIDNCSMITHEEVVASKGVFDSKTVAV